MTSHYIGDAHMPFHCDNRRLGDSKADGHAHGDIEDLWGTSRAIMHDAVTSIAMFWQDLWLDFVTK